MVIHGKALYGRVDEVPDVFRVQSLFIHVFFFPFVPLGTYVELAVPVENPVTIRIRWSVKSVLLAWVRAGLTVMALGPCGVLLARLGDKQHLKTAECVVLVLWACGYATLRLLTELRVFRRASPKRARQIAEELGMDCDVVTQIEALARGEVVTGHIVMGRRCANPLDASRARRRWSETPPRAPF